MQHSEMLCMPRESLTLVLCIIKLFGNIPIYVACIAVTAQGWRKEIIGNSVGVFIPKIS